MNKYTIWAFVGLCMCVNCTNNVRSSKKVNVDLEQRISLDAVTDYLQPDSLVLVSSNEFAIANFDRTIRRGTDIYVLDKMQQAVFKVNTSSRSLQRIINCRGNAQNEYLSITDIAMDASNNIYVYDSDSRKINLYNADGKFLRTMHAVCGSSIALSDDEIVINTNQLEDNQIVVFSLSGELLYQTAPYVEQKQKYTLDDIGSIVALEDGFLYVTPFDFNIYQADETGYSPFVLLNCGESQFDVREMEGLDYLSYQRMLMKNSDKVMSFHHLCAYNNLIFFSTDRSDQLLYDTKKDSVVTISNVEAPYNTLFSSPVSVSRDGQFCVALSNTNIRDGYLSWFKTNKTKLPQLQPATEAAGNDSFWLLMGHVH